jgi:crossover junction endodeoxyribonuclease RuvC
VASGCIRLDGAVAARLARIFDAIGSLIAEHRPAAGVIENIFVAKNAMSALKLGQARGAAICAMAVAGLDVHEYSPREVKQALVGGGGADKSQVAYMVGLLLNRRQVAMKLDESDALAVALCHAHGQRLNVRLAALPPR